MNTWCVYVIECRDGTLYTGVTTDVQRRFAEHASGNSKSAKYLRGRGPLRLVHSEQVESRSLAQSLEMKIKGLSKSTKLAVVNEGGSFSDHFAQTEF